MARKIAIDLEKLKELHSQGLTDGKIGQFLGCGAVTIGKHRKILGLKVNSRGGRKGGQPKAVRSVRSKAAALEAAIVKAEQAEVLPEAENGAMLKVETRARCRVAMFEVEGSETAIVAAVEAVKAALQRRD